MSKLDIEIVCTLAAHLAQRQHQLETGIGCYDEYISTPSECASDAMQLQKLGARTKRAAYKYAHDSRYAREKYDPEIARIGNLAAHIIACYGLTCLTGSDELGPCLFIVGLPCNTESGPKNAFGI